MLTVHTKNLSPETGFNAEPTSEHKTEKAALEAAKELAASPKTHGNTVLVQEKGTNRTWTVQKIAGEATVGLDEGVPYLVEGDAHFQITYDAREVPVEIRQETDENGGVAVYLDQPEGHPLVGEFDVHTEEIAK
jgi:hypothetical protein